MADLGPIPLAAEEDEPGEESAEPGFSPSREASRRHFPHTPWLSEAQLARLLIVVLGGLHSLAIWWGMGGLAGLNNSWPLWRDDHPLYYHSALVTRSFLRLSGTTAGYDPSFMAGYAKSVIFPASSTLPELVVAAFGGSHPAFAYKVYVLVSAALLPWLVALAAWVWNLRPSGGAMAVLLFLLYVWTDFPINYAAFGMLPYLLSIPLGLFATGVFGRFLVQGGITRWLLAALLMSLVFLVHLTSALIVAPASVLAYLTAFIRASREGERNQSRIARQSVRSRSERIGPRALPVSRHLGTWSIAAVVLAVNAFWWLPGFWLASTKGESDFVLVHKEGVLRRLVQIITMEAPIESVLLAVGVPGLVVLIARGRVKGMALLGFCLAGLGWGYLAGGLRSLDFLQPGRHTYAFYTSLALAGGAGLDAVLIRLRSESGPVARLDRWVLLGLALIGFRIMGPSLLESVRGRLFLGEPFLSSRPSSRLLWVVDRVRKHMKPGERLLYEESGFDLPGIPDPYQHGRFSGLLPERTGVEVIGGPYLHASLTTNFTQFGEGKLFGSADWDRERFVRYARIYRPAAILCWSPRARRFCQSNPDLVTILDDDGTILIGRIKGFDGDTIVGSAKVEAEPGRLRIREMSPGLDGSILLRYHSVPCLRTVPPIPCESEFQAEDPVPFIRLRPPPGIREVELQLAVPSGLAGR